MTETTRRTLIRNAAWSVPVISAVAAAPAFAASLRKDPGINGWVQISTTDRDDNSYDLRFNSNIDGNGPDGAPYGLYVYNPNRNGNTLLDTYTNASMTLWVRTTNSDNTPANNGWSNPGTGWGNATDAGLANKPDGLQYRGYRFAYTGGYTLVASEERVYLRDFDTSSDNIRGTDATYWIERQITVNGVVQTFQRRNGDRGPLGNGFPSSQRRAAGGDMVATA
jgi:hypothetical protein